MPLITADKAFKQIKELHLVLITPNIVQTVIRLQLLCKRIFIYGHL